MDDGLDCVGVVVVVGGGVLDGVGGWWFLPAI